jgi:hypothetical protein
MSNESGSPIVEQFAEIAKAEKALKQERTCAPPAASPAVQALALPASYFTDTPWPVVAERLGIQQTHRSLPSPECTPESVETSQQKIDRLITKVQIRLTRSDRPWVHIGNHPGLTIRADGRTEFYPCDMSDDEKLKLLSLFE